MTAHQAPRDIFWVFDNGDKRRGLPREFGGQGSTGVFERAACGLSHNARALAHARAACLDELLG